MVRVGSTHVVSALTSTYLCGPTILKYFFVQVIVEKSVGTFLGIVGYFPLPYLQV